MNPMRIAFLLPILGAGCTFNVDAVSEEKHASYEGSGWSSFRSELSDIPSGLTIRGSDRTSAEATASVVGLLPAGEGSALERARLALVPDGSTLELQVRTPDDFEEQLFFDWIEVDLPRDREVEIDTASGDVSVLGMSAPVRVDSSSGDVRVETTGRVEIDCSSGDVDATAAGGVIDVSSGEVSLRLAHLDFDEMEIDTSSGDVSVRVPPGAGLDLEIDTSSGDVEIRVGGTVFHGDEGFSGRINGGGPRLRIDASSGDVTVRD